MAAAGRGGGRLPGRGSFLSRRRRGAAAARSGAAMPEATRLCAGSGAEAGSDSPMESEAATANGRRRRKVPGAPGSGSGERLRGVSRSLRLG